MRMEHSDLLVTGGNNLPKKTSVYIQCVYKYYIQCVYKVTHSKSKL